MPLSGQKNVSEKRDCTPPDGIEFGIRETPTKTASSPGRNTVHLSRDKATKLGNLRDGKEL